jgi:Rrf2 family nitric oxide-sensitive transcriptional repressor
VSLLPRIGISNTYLPCYRLIANAFWTIAMQLTTFTDFGLRALMRLAGEPDRSFTTDEISREFGISRNHLVKIVRSLAEAGFVATQRGSGGGFRLARPSDAITIGEIVRALESRYPLVECFRADGGACVLMPRCRLKARLAAAREAFFAELDRTTLAQCAYPDPLSSTIAGVAP